MLNLLQKGICWVEYEFLQDPDDLGDGTFIHLRKVEGDFRLNLVSILDDSRRFYVVDLEHGCSDCGEWRTMCWVVQKDVKVVAGLMQEAQEEIDRTPAEKSSPFWSRHELN